MYLFYLFVMCTVSSQLGTKPTRPQSTRPQDNSAPKTTRPQVNSAPLPTRPQGQLGPKFKCKALTIVYSNFNATKHKTCSTGSIVQNSVVSRPRLTVGLGLVRCCLPAQYFKCNDRVASLCQCKPTTYNTVQRARLSMGGVAFSITRRGLGSHVLLGDLV